MTGRFFIAYLLAVFAFTVGAAWWCVHGELRALEREVEAARGVDTSNALAAALRNERKPARVRFVVARYVCPRRRYWAVRVVLVEGFSRLRYSPDELLATYMHIMYLGEVNGRHISGVDDAARTYFHKSLRELSPAEARWIVQTERSPRRRPALPVSPN